MTNKLSQEDIDEIYEIGKIINPNYKNLYDLNKLTPNDIIYTYKENNKIKGFLHIYNGIDIIDIINIAVVPDYQNQQIGTKLLEQLINNHPNKKIMLEVKSTNYIAIKLYQKFNFQPINIRKQYYKDKTDAIIMERK